MPSKLARISALCSVLAFAGAQSTAWGQVFCGDPCCSPCPVACCQPQPQTCTVPVTEYRQCRQIVHRPVVQTTYVDQPCTEYRQVCETKTACVPQVSYQTVTECRTVQKDCGHWVTQQHCRPMVSPCQYDNRPDLMGFLNRTGYSIRMAFTPKVYTTRSYVPNVVTQQIPITRQVPVTTMKHVSYKVSRMVPYTTTRRVAVNTVRMVAQEVVTNHPVTVFKTVPYGSAMAYGGSFGGPRTAYGYGDRVGPPRTNTALAPVPDPVSTAIRPRDTYRESAVKPVPRTSRLPDALNDKADSFDGDRATPSERPATRTSYHERIDGYGKVQKQPGSSMLGDYEIAELPAPRRNGGWVARKSSGTVKGPILPEISIASTGGLRR